MARESGYKFKITNPAGKIPKGGYIDTEGFLIMPRLMRPKEIAKYQLVDLNKGYTKLSIYRSSAGLRQTDLARITGIPLKTIQGWELRGMNGANLVNCVKVADALGVKDLRDLMEDE